jgi:recombinational DNA repair protein RecR
MYANQKRYYSPQFSAISAVSARRLAWSLGLPMPKAVDQVVSKLPSLFPPVVVCASCKDNTKCNLCIFSKQPQVLDAVSAV